MLQLYLFFFLVVGLDIHVMTFNTDLRVYQYFIPDMTFLCQNDIFINKIIGQ